VPAPALNEAIANLSISNITIFVVAATALRLGLIRTRSTLAQSIAELLESGLLVVVGMFLIVRPFVFQAFFIPSPSMEPTLLGKNGSGDRILVNKLVYRVATPKRDDVVVFIPPPSATDGVTEESPGVPINFIKRLVGLPGDRLQTTAGRVWIGGQPYSHAQLRMRLADAGEFGDETLDSDPQADHHIKFTKRGVLIDGRVMSDARLSNIITGGPNAMIKVEPGLTMIDGRVINEPFTAEDPDYDMQLYHGQPLKLDAMQVPKLDGEVISMQDYMQYRATGPDTVPPHSFFMMGDNRNDSRDSTEWGPLSSNQVVGRAQAVFWPLNRIRAIH